MIKKITDSMTVREVNLSLLEEAQECTDIDRLRKIIKTLCLRANSAISLLENSEEKIKELEVLIKNESKEGRNDE